MMLPFRKLATFSIILLSLQVYAKDLLAEESASPTTNQIEPPSKHVLEIGDVVEVSTGDGNRSFGKSNAPLVLLEFTDYQCPYCAGFYEKTLPELKARFIDKGMLRFVARDLPLEYHPDALPMARAARCGDAQSAFAKVSAALYLQPFRRARSREEALDQIAKDASIDQAQFRKCFSEANFDKEIAADMANAASINVTGTPTFVLGRAAGGKLSGIAIPGAYPTETFIKLIEENYRKLTPVRAGKPIRPREK
ncbi:protein-disulfide isomerase [Bradyrhizobium sp. S3.12.5]|uniref:DsbA family protein n=1 Tax=Bradyrhizobium sp. S3.12.5 TaxID=3156386 RepID=UPI003391A55F